MNRNRPRKGKANIRSSSRTKGLNRCGMTIEKLTVVGIFNSCLFSALLCGCALWALYTLETCVIGESSRPIPSAPVLPSVSESLQQQNPSVGEEESRNEITVRNVRDNEVSLSSQQKTSSESDRNDANRRWVRDSEFGIYSYKRKDNGDGPDCIVFMTDREWWNASLSAIYNARDPSLGNWTGPIILMGNGINREETQLDLVLECMGVTYFDITHDKLKESFGHLYFQKSFILLHDYFRQPFNKFNKVIYLDSDVFAVREWPHLMDRVVWRPQDYVAWREDPRHGSWYKAALNLNKYDEQTKEELHRAYPDHPDAKQANVMIFDMLRLPKASVLERDIRIILEKYGEGFYRHDQSLFNFLLYHNSTDLSFSAFNGPPEDKLFTPPNEKFPLVHTGHSEAMYQVGNKYHLLHLYYLHNIKQICPHRHLFK